MIVDKVALLSGKPVIFENTLVYSPTIDQITEPDIGEAVYSIFLILCSFDKKKIYVNLFGISKEKIDQFSEIDDYDFLTSDEEMCKQICIALSFFVHEKVFFDIVLKKFRTDKGIFITKDNYKQFSELLLVVNGGIIEQKKEEPRPIFQNKFAEEMYEEMLKLKEAEEEAKKERERGGDKDFGLKDILSILCNFDGNGINVFNIKNLTIFQIYEQFERLGLREAYARALPVWANGHWDMKKHPFPEWMIKTKL